MANNEWYLYILECKNGRYYTGITKDVEKRYLVHKNGTGAKFTQRNKVKAIVYTEKCGNMNDARKREVQIKDWDRKKKEKLINDIYER